MGVSDESDEKKIPNGVNGHSTAGANPKISTLTKIPVINTSDMNYIVMVNNGTEKQENNTFIIFGAIVLSTLLNSSRLDQCDKESSYHQYIHVDDLFMMSGCQSLELPAVL